MKRRDFITLLGGAAAWPMAARAQQPERVRRIGVLMPQSGDRRRSRGLLEAFVQGLEALGWSEGRNLQMDVRWAAGDPALLRNRFGRGRAFLITARRPGLYYGTGGAGTGLPAETRPGFPKLLRALVDAALEADRPPLRIERAPDGLEVQVRQVEGASVVHLLDWHDSRVVHGVRLAINVPGPLEVLYPADEKAAPTRITGPATIPVRAFRCHEMVAVRAARG